MPKFRKKPVVIEAEPVVRVHEDMAAFARLVVFLGAGGPWVYQQDGSIEIRTLEGVMRAEPGDYIIRGVKGELYPCKPDIFAATYEPAEDW